MRFAFTLALGLLFSTAAFAQPTDLLISEYVEGSSLNKAIELYNGTGSAIDLGAGSYSLQFFFNGSSSAGTVINLTGTVADGDVFVVADDGADSLIIAVSDTLSTSSFFNGDDAVVLYRDTTVVDIIGQIGFDPGSEWGVDSTNVATQNNTLRRKATACTGDTNPDDAFDPAVDYEGFPQDTFDGLGSAIFSCGGGGFAIVPTLTAVNPPIVVPASGGSLQYRVSLENTSGSSETFDAWIVAILPNSSVFQVRGPQAVTLTAGQSIGPITFSESVPAAAPAGTYTLELRVGDFPSTVEASDSFTFTKSAPRLAANAQIVESVSAYPNPFNPQTTLRFSVTEASPVRLAVYDLLGREVAVLVNERLDAGAHAATFDARGLASGVYVWRLEAGSTVVQTGRLTLLK